MVLKEWAFCPFPPMWLNDIQFCWIISPLGWQVEWAVSAVKQVEAGYLSCFLFNSLTSALTKRIRTVPSKLGQIMDANNDHALSFAICSLWELLALDLPLKGQLIHVRLLTNCSLNTDECESASDFTDSCRTPCYILII